MIVFNLFFDPKVLIVSWKTFLNFLTVPGAYYRKYGTPLRRNKLFIWACQIKTANQKKTQKNLSQSDLLRRIDQPEKSIF